MMKITREQWMIFGAVALGLVLGKVLKNFKIGFAIALILALAFAMNVKKRKR